MRDRKGEGREWSRNMMCVCTGRVFHASSAARLAPRAVLGKWRGGRDRKWHHLSSLGDQGQWCPPGQRRYMRNCASHQEPASTTWQPQLETGIGKTDLKRIFKCVLHSYSGFECALHSCSDPELRTHSFLLKSITLVLSSLNQALKEHRNFKCTSHNACRCCNLQ